MVMAGMTTLSMWSGHFGALNVVFMLNLSLTILPIKFQESDGGVKTC